MQQSLPFNAGVGRGIGLIRPVPGKRVGATGSAADDQRLDSRHAASLQNGEALTVKGVEGVGDLSPSQRRVVGKCF